MTTMAFFLVGTIFGIGLTAGLVLWLMRRRMVVSHRSRRSFEETCAAIEETIPANKGWGFPIPTWHFYETLRKKNQVPKGFVKLKVFFVCNSGLASRVLGAEPSMAGIMPCSWAVYELADGTAWLSKMNIGMMAKMFSGVIGATMGAVAQADEEFLATVLGEDGTPAPAVLPAGAGPEPAGVQFEKE